VKFLDPEVFIGKGTWLDKVAHELIEREKMLKRSLVTVKVESGLGASGIPHLGSLGDAVRAYGIAIALKNMGYDSQLLAYSDDMDGLRKVPGLSRRPHTYETGINHLIIRILPCLYRAHMTDLLDALDKGNKIAHVSARRLTKLGCVNDDMILKNHERIGKKIAKIVGQEKYARSLPYFPICDNCGRVYVASSTEYFSDKRMIDYHCVGTRIGDVHVEGCGYHGETFLEEGNGKLP
jgi:lysyl-tRNA synthetase class 1